MRNQKHMQTLDERRKFALQRIAAAKHIITSYEARRDELFTKLGNLEKDYAAAPEMLRRAQRDLDAADQAITQAQVVTGSRKTKRRETKLEKLERLRQELADLESEISAE